MQSAGKIARKYGLKIHLDGARIFNAAVALETDVRELTRDADSVSFCLSKGLAAPAGSLVCGSKEFIARARRSRKLVGGAMRQAGVLAAAGIADRLSQDHFHARKLAEGLANIKGISADTEKVKTNIVFFEITRGNLTAQTLSGQLNSEGVRMLPLDPFRLRAVTHYHITSDDIEYVLKVFAGILK